MSRHIDVHELLKCASRDDDALNSGKPVVFGLSDQYVIFDSFLKSPASNIAQGLFVWNMIVQGSTGNQVIGVNNVIENMIEMQVGPFVFPQVQDVPYIVNRDNNTPSNEIRPGIPGQVYLRQNNTSTPATITVGVDDMPVPYTWPSYQNGSPMLQINGVSGGIEYGQYPNSILINSPTAPLSETCTLPWLNNPYTQLPNGRLTIQVQEVGLQSISDLGGSRHNFECDLEYRTDIGKSASTYQAKPLKDWDTYIFTQPITSLQGISLVFRNPDIPIVFEPDVYRNVEFQFGGLEFYINFILAYHNLRVGDRIYIKDFQGWAGSGNLAAFMNRPEGFVVANYDDVAVLPHANPAVDNPLDHGMLLQNPGRFTIDPAVSIKNITGGVPVPPVSMSVTVYVEKRRMRIPMRFRSVVPKMTNRIVPV